MSDERLRAIKDRLAAASPGIPWRGVCSALDYYHESGQPPIPDEDDLALAANAPSDIAYLLSLLELVQRAEAVQHKVNW